jgi:phosphatidylinositol glycan class M
LFSFADLVAGVLIRQILIENSEVTLSPSPLPPRASTSGCSTEDNLDSSTHPPTLKPAKPKHASTHRTATLLAAAHLLNPLVFAISTRGSSESLLLLLVLLALSATLRGRWNSSAIWIGIAAHWKIYPAIYGVPCIAALAAEAKLRRKGKHGVLSIVQAFVNAKTVRFGAVAAATFFALGGACYAVWGEPFLREAYWYHVGRRDHRHNFAPYFYLAYLGSGADASASAGAGTITMRTPAPTMLQSILRSPLTSFLPQLVASIGSGLLLGGDRRHAPFVWFVQTACFVLFNKVCTSQVSQSVI